MPNLNPKDNKLPADWRQPFDAFTRLKSVGKILKEPVETWTLERPSRVGKLVGSGWRLHYTFKKETYSIYLGSNGRVSAETIQTVYDDMLEYAKSLARNRAPIVPANKSLPKINPITDTYKVLGFYKEWTKFVGEFKGQSTWADYLNAQPRAVWLNKFFKQRAGILNMSLIDYIRKHPHARVWPNPPMSQAEYENRQRELLHVEQDRQQRRRDGEILPPPFTVFDDHFYRS